MLYRALVRLPKQTLMYNLWVQIWSESSLECRTTAPTWEALWKSVSGPGRGDGQAPWVNMGRVHWRTQRHLVSW